VTVYVQQPLIERASPVVGVVVVLVNRSVAVPLRDSSPTAAVRRVDGVPGW
jgi:hypothetical protein